MYLHGSLENTRRTVENIVADRAKGILVITSIGSTPCPLEGLKSALDSITLMKVLPWVVEGAGGLGAGKTSGAGTRGVSLDVVIGGRTGYSNTNGGESSDNRSKVHADCYPAENPSL